MKPRYEQSTGQVVIEWYEKKKNGSPVHHHYSQKPTTLQLHPKEPERVIRATFADKIPTWMEKYASEHSYRCQQVTRSGEVGWWLANWRSYIDGNKPLTSPNLDGALEQLARKIPDVCERLKETVLENRETIKKNLRNYPDVFGAFGLFFRPEEILGVAGALVFDDGVIPARETDESDEDYLSRIERDGRLEKLVFELITPLPEPVRVDERADEENSDDEVLTLGIEFVEEEEELSLDGLTLEDVEDEGNPSLDGIELEDEKEMSLAGIELEDDVESEPSENPVEETLEINEPEEEEAGVTAAADTTIAETEPEADIAAPADVGEQSDPDANTVTTVISTEEVEQPIFDEELKIADTTDKRVVEGQFALF